MQHRAGDDTDRSAAGERERHQQRRDTEQQPQQRLPAALSNRLGDLDVDRVVGLAEEAREWIRGKEQERRDVGAVAEVAGEKVVERQWHAPREQRHEPAGDRGERRADRPDLKPEEVRNREQQPEEDREPRTTQIVIESDLYGVAVHAGESTMRRCR